MRANPSVVVFCLALTMWLLQASTSAAQDTFGDLGRRVQPGQTVIVVDQFGGRTQGRVASLSTTTLVVNAGPPRSFSPADVREVLKPDRMWDGAVKGAAFGVIPAVLLGALDCDDCVPGAMAALSIGVGAGVGFGLDALFGPRTVFRGTTRAPHISVVPIAGRERLGMTASFRF